VTQADVLINATRDHLLSALNTIPNMVANLAPACRKAKLDADAERLPDDVPRVMSFTQGLELVLGR
jgi:hypothetical protein